MSTDLPKTFKVGDTARLNSGGPLMTVVYVSEHGAVTCAWFSSDGSSSESSFPSACLTRAFAEWVQTLPVIGDNTTY